MTQTASLFPSPYVSFDPALAWWGKSQEWQISLFCLLQLGKPRLNPIWRLVHCWWLIMAASYYNSSWAHTPSWCKGWRDAGTTGTHSKTYTLTHIPGGMRASTRQPGWDRYSVGLLLGQELSLPCAFVTERTSESLCIALCVSSLLMW